MKITLITQIYPDLGISVYTDHLINSLQSKIDRIDVIGFKKIYPDFLYPVKNTNEKIEPHYNDHVKIKRVIVWWNFFTWIKAAFLCRTKVVHYQWWTHILFPIFFLLLLVNKLRGKTNIITAHNILSHESKKFSKLANKIIFSFGDHFIVHNKKSKRQLEKLFNVAADKISIIPIAVYNRLYIRYDKTEARQILSWDKDLKYLLFAGHIRQYKGLELLLRAFAEIAQNNPEARLVVAGQIWGEWEKYAQIINFFGLNNRVIIKTKYLSNKELSLYISAADLAIMPYDKFDGSSGLLKTFLYFGIPIIASDIDDFREQLDKRNLFHAGSVAALTRKINLFLSNPNVFATTNLSINDWRQNAVKHLHIYKKYV